MHTETHLKSEVFMVEVSRIIECGDHCKLPSDYCYNVLNIRPSLYQFQICE
jgi:hypothetical protein